MGSGKHIQPKNSPLMFTKLIVGGRQDMMFPKLTHRIYEGCTETNKTVMCSTPPYNLSKQFLFVVELHIFTASPKKTTWTAILEKWQPKFQGTEAEQIEKLLKHYSPFKNSLISVREIPGGTNLEMRFAVEKSDFTTCTMSCVEHHAKRVVDHLTSPDAALSVTFQGNSKCQGNWYRGQKSHLAMYTDPTMGEEIFGYRYGELPDASKIREQKRQNTVELGDGAVMLVWSHTNSTPFSGKPKKRSPTIFKAVRTFKLICKSICSAGFTTLWKTSRLNDPLLDPKRSCSFLLFVRLEALGGWQYFHTYMGKPVQWTSRWVSRMFGLCSTLSVPNCHATRRLHEDWDTARLSKPRQGKSRGRGRIRTTDLPALHMYEFYQSGVEATIVRLTAAKNTGTLVGAAAIYAVPNSVKTELWMASVKKKFQRVLTLYPSMNFAASVKKSRRLCNFGDPSALQLYFIVEGHLDRISKHTEWRDLQNERSKVYEEYMNATYESLYKAVPMLQSSKSELHRLSFDSFIIHKDGNINGVFTLIVDAVHLKKIGTVDSYFTINSDVPPGAVFPSRSDPLTKFQVNLIALLAERIDLFDKTFRKYSELSATVFQHNTSIPLAAKAKRIPLVPNHNTNTGHLAQSVAASSILYCPYEICLNMNQALQKYSLENTTVSVTRDGNLQPSRRTVLKAFSQAIRKYFHSRVIVFGGRTWNTLWQLSDKKKRIRTLLTLIYTIILAFSQAIRKYFHSRVIVFGGRTWNTLWQLSDKKKRIRTLLTLIYTIILVLIRWLMNISAGNDDIRVTRVQYHSIHYQASGEKQHFCAQGDLVDSDSRRDEEVRNSGDAHTLAQLVATTSPKKPLVSEIITDKSGRPIRSSLKLRVVNFQPQSQLSTQRRTTNLELPMTDNTRMLFID
ncbi:hypothetical protein CLF_110145 [Clonorchis sinensis]|uniref:Uncharacterized protein n=2 Tax=Clonorchis sinensis TaxID=79923 RepID=G7YKB7_CLOSI|nr:hypothetical protein CLF_110145 [Clonorchis sinensis]